MLVPGSSTPLLAHSAAAAATGISRSLRFNSSDSAYLSRTPASAGDRRKFTFAAWVKIASLTAGQNVLFSVTDGTTPFAISWQSDGALIFGTLSFAWKETTAKLRDYSAWYHICVSVDTDQASNANRLKFYVNGTQQTDFSTNRDLYLNTNIAVNGGFTHEIGRYSAGSNQYFNGLLADVFFIDGQQLTPSSFTETDATTGQLIPKAYTGSYGTNGFHLEFADNSSNTATTLGKDTSGNSPANNWTPFNLSTTTGGPTSVASASGALPIYNTTDTYGTTKGTGTRTDSNSSSIVLAVAMDGTNNGTTFTDESATIKGSGSAKSITVTGNTKTSTAQSKFYGSSGLFDSSGDVLTVPAGSDFAYGTGDFTVEAWIYPQSSAERVLYSQSVSGTNYFVIFRETTGAITFRGTLSGGGTSITSSGTTGLNTWSHVAIVRQSGTVNIYVNGLSSASSSNTTNFSNTSYVPTIGAYTHATSDSWNGHISDFRIYKGVAKYTGNFNPPSSTANVTVAAGNDSLVDVPTNGAQTDTGVGGEVRGNYCTLNPLQSELTLSNGNLEAASYTSAWKAAASTIYASSGKWYCEFVATTVVAYPFVGVYGQSSSALSGILGQQATGYSYNGFDGTKRNNGSATSYGATWGANDVIGIALDLDNGAIYFSKNGSWQNGGVPTSGASKTGAAFSLPLTTAYAFAVSSYGNDYVVANFGQRPFAYTAPSGFKALCTANLPAPLVTKPNTVMDVALYTGNGGNQSITLPGGFNPDLVWVKSRSNSQDHYLFDAIRGGAGILRSNTTGAETTGTTYLSFDTSGFSSLNGLSSNGYTYAAWTWDAGSSTVTNTQGSITSSVRANATAGFSVVTYTGNSTAGATVGHGLGVAPAFIISKSRSNSSEWSCYHQSLGNAQSIILNTTAAAGSSSTWNSTSPTSTVVTLGVSGSTNFSGYTHVMYCFAPVVGYSSFGSYTGNGSTDGPFVYTGFRPRFILVKRTDGVIQWTILDTARSPSNVADQRLFPNLSQAETVNGDGNTDLLSNGFKPRTVDSAFNASGGTYIYAAFAESPFQYARAR